jgi:hypothetical protein
VLVEATHIEASKVKQGMENVSKGKENGKKEAMVKKFKEKHTCSRCGKKGHEEDKC